MDTSFEWDERKNEENAKKHGASYQAMIRRLLDYYLAN